MIRYKLVNTRVSVVSKKPVPVPVQINNRAKEWFGDFKGLAQFSVLEITTIRRAM